MSTLIETERLLLRQWTDADAGELFALASDPEVMRYVDDGLAWTDISQAHRWLARRVADCEERVSSTFFAVIEKASGRIIGSCGFTFLSELSEIDFGYLFARETWGRGYATEATRAVLRYGFEQLGFEEVTANTVEENHVSRRVLEKIGFEFRGMRRYAGEEEDSAFYVARKAIDEGGGRTNPTC